MGVLRLNNHKETPEEIRERLRQSELKNNPSGNLTDLAGGLGWKGMGMMIIGIIVGYVLYNLLF